MDASAPTSASDASWPWLVTAPTFSELVTRRAGQSPDRLRTIQKRSPSSTSR